MIFKRSIESGVKRALSRGKSILLLGPRQSGKTTFVKQLPHDRYINLMDMENFYGYKQEPGLLAKEVKALAKLLKRPPMVIIDEIQKIPQLTNDCQVLIDEGIASFIITGSSARKIMNLLPGRVVLFKLSTLTLSEYGKERDLDSILVNGFLPGICQQSSQEAIEQDLKTYVSVYLEEEIRKEALVRNLGSFVNFLRVACIESGNIMNISAVSQQLGVSHHTVSEYFRIMEDCLLVRRIEPLSTGKNSRRRLTKAVRYILFDLGLRRVGALEGISPNTNQKGHLLEQYVGIELATLIDNESIPARLLFWRDHNGPEVDYVIELDKKYIPIEVKLTSTPKDKDIRHLKAFREEYPVKDYCYLIANVKHPYEIEEGIMVLPWSMVHNILKG